MRYHNKSQQKTVAGGEKKRHNCEIQYNILLWLRITTLIRKRKRKTVKKQTAATVYNNIYCIVLSRALCHDII